MFAPGAAHWGRPRGRHKKIALLTSCIELVPARPGPRARGSKEWRMEQQTPAAHRWKWLQKIRRKFAQWRARTASFKRFLRA
ncbi:hypothetical protein BS50DRAFT_366340 [Corynespora cassiicola Philippines]|uniref:Uncharacterized protein n=1 Tax=Corynespora cassiicola Philippines TaxID=1448308 RepID=A0A2T2NSX1_CORCC|nr:hypothetical protein BS50DRAFT_366340 [Corynespora cassiicola Philippines]